MKLIAYRTDKEDEGWSIEPAPRERSWMDETPNRYAYRCLPLVMANQAGWIIRCPVDFSVRWNGRLHHENSLKFRFAENPERHSREIMSNFGSGIVTFALPFLFRTEEKVGLLVRGMPNSPKVNATPLEGYVETDWSPFTFTMNWKLHIPWYRVRFRKGEPICFLQPFNLEYIESVQPEFKAIGDKPELEAEHRQWSASRTAFNADPERGGDWQKHYFRGEHFDEEKTRTAEHRTDVHIQPFSPDQHELGESDRGES